LIPDAEVKAARTGGDRAWRRRAVAVESIDERYVGNYGPICPQILIRFTSNGAVQTQQTHTKGHRRIHRRICVHVAYL
jgi:hypothetical protein